MESDTRIALVALLIVILIVLALAWLVPRLLGRPLTVHGKVTQEMTLVLLRPIQAARH